MSEPVIARRAVVSGRVQGVAFRASVRREAEARGVAGWVRNLADGTVEAHVEGAPRAVEAVIGHLHRGPRDARVASVAIDETPPAGMAGFTIR